MTPDVINPMFKNAGTNAPIRNFLVDFNDEKGEAYFKPLQTVCIGNCSDDEIENGIMQDIEMEHMTVNAITEVYGQHSLEELSDISRKAKLLLVTGFKYLYLKNKKSH